MLSDDSKAHFNKMGLLTMGNPVSLITAYRA